MPEEAKKTGRGRGFASLTPERQREIASRGGKAAHASGRAHTFTSDEAREAGRKGGAKSAESRAHMAEIGRVGGRRRWEAARAHDTERPPPTDRDPAEGGEP